MDSPHAWTRPYGLARTSAPGTEEGHSQFPQGCLLLAPPPGRCHSWYMNPQESLGSTVLTPGMHTEDTDPKLSFRGPWRCKGPAPQAVSTARNTAV